MKDEPNFIDFQLNKNILEEWLVKIKLRDDRDFFTYEKLKGIERIAKGYFENIMKKRNLSYFKKEVDHGCYEYVCSKLVV